MGNILCPVTQFVAQQSNQFLRQGRLVVFDPEQAGARCLEAGIAAGVDALEGFEVVADVDGEAVIGAAASHTQAECGDLFSVDIDPGGICACL